MDPETAKLLKESLEVSKQNNEMLKKLVRSQQVANIYRFVYWGVIIFSSIGAYYFIQPFLGNLLNVYGVSGINNVSDVTKTLNSNKQQMEDLLNALKK